MKTAKIKEIFSSIQGEGPYVGYLQTFVRFCGCNLSCAYCDTEFGESSDGVEVYDSQQLADRLNSTPNIHSVSLTGGEPLLWADFLVEVLPLVKADVYLETNGTLIGALEQVIRYVDVISMDIKLDSSSENGSLFNLHDSFLHICVENNKNTFIKLVFDENIAEEEIIRTAELAQKYDLELVLQPVMGTNSCLVKTDFIEQVFDKFVVRHPKTRLIPQTHKFLNIQ